ncbi:MAG: ABC transporter permease [Rhodoferax sp.]|nr:ABC transporter permease [Rhodoferax sp.]MCF8210047.1 ABC transporter permease [Rhodoferax sp.]
MRAHAVNAPRASWVQGGLIRLAPLLLVLLVWQMAGDRFDAKTLPRPSIILGLLWRELTMGDLLWHVGMTLRRVTLSFSVALVLGVALGVAMGIWKKLDQALDTFLIIGLNIPALVVIVLSYIWFGLTEQAAILAVTLNKIPMVAISLREGARALDRSLIQVARVYQLSRFDTFVKVILPQLLPYLFGAIRNGLSVIWKIVLVVELLGCSNGVGFQIGSYFHFFDIAGVLAYTIAFTTIIFSVEVLLLRPAERHLLGWRA